MHARRKERTEFIERELRGFAKSPVNLCVHAVYVRVYVAAAAAKSFTGAVRTANPLWK